MNLGKPEKRLIVVDERIPADDEPEAPANADQQAAPTAAAEPTAARPAR